MTVRSIVRFPDRRLSAVAEPVLVFDEDLRRLATDLVPMIARP
jgi:peptide deformylase